MSISIQKVAALIKRRYWSWVKKVSLCLIASCSDAHKMNTLIPRYCELSLFLSFQRSEYFIKGKIVKNSIHSKHQNNMRMYKSEQHWGMSVIHLLVVKIFTVQLFFTVISNRWAWFENYVNVDIDSFLCFWIRSTWNAAKHLINEKETFFYDCAWVRL